MARAGEGAAAGGRGAASEHVITGLVVQVTQELAAVETEEETIKIKEEM